nr:S-norcoclaurine synthase 2-like [Tanacetum cinerariifolium]
MSQDVLTVGSTMRIPLLYQGEYSQCSERFMNYQEEQTDGEAMINCIKNGDQPLPCVTQIDRLARSLLIQRLPNDIYSLIDSNKTTKDLWDALAGHMLGFEYGEQDRKAAILVETICNNDEREQEFMDINIDVLYNILKQNQEDVNDSMGLKKKTIVVTSDLLALIAEKTKVSKRKEKFVVSLDSEGSDTDDFGELKKKVEAKVAPSKAWQLYKSLELGKVVGEHFLEKLELIEGDGGVGTVLKLTYKPEYGIPSYKEKFTKIDDENMVKEVEVVEGGFLDNGFSLYRVRIEVKVNPNDATGLSSLVRSTIEYELKEEAASNASLVTMEPLMIVMKVANEYLVNSG